MSPAGPRAWERQLVRVLLLAGLVLILALTAKRAQLESASRTVELAFSERRLLQLIPADPRAPEWVAAAGVTLLMREPYTLEDLVRYGLAEAYRPGPGRLEVRIADRTLSAHAAMFLSSQLGPGGLRIRPRPEVNIFDVTVPGRAEPSRFVLEIPSGTMPAPFRRGLRLPAGDWGASSDLDQFTTALSSLRPDVVLPDWRGGQGASYFFDSYLNTAWLKRPALALALAGLPTAAVRALRPLQRPVLPALILDPAALSSSAKPGWRERLRQALHKHQVRLIYFRSGAAWAPSVDQQWLARLAREIRAAGFRLGPAAPAPLMRSSAFVRQFLLLAMAAAFFLFLWQAAVWAAGSTGQTASAGTTMTIRLRPSYFRVAAGITALALLVIQQEGPFLWGACLGTWLAVFLGPLLGVLALQPEVAAQAPSRSWVLGALDDALKLTGWHAAGGLGAAAVLFYPEVRLGLFACPGLWLAAFVAWLAAGIIWFPNFTDRVWWQAVFRPDRRMGAWLGLALSAAGLAWWVLVVFTPAQLEPIRLLGVDIRVTQVLGFALLGAGLAARRRDAPADPVWPRVLIWVGLIGPASLLVSLAQGSGPILGVLAGAGVELGLGALLSMVIVRTVCRDRSGGN